MKVIENTATRLELRLAGAGPFAGLFVLDRDRGEAEITRFALGIPFARERLPLSQITGVVVKRPNRRKAYHPMIEVVVGKAVSICACAKDEAFDAARAIREFLKPPV